MCMMCDEDAIYTAYLEWKAQKEREEAAAAAAAIDASQPASPQTASDNSNPSCSSKPSFTCD